MQSNQCLTSKKRYHKSHNPFSTLKTLTLNRHAKCWWLTLLKLRKLKHLRHTKKMPKLRLRNHLKPQVTRRLFNHQKRRNTQWAKLQIFRTQRLFPLIRFEKELITTSNQLSFHCGPSYLRTTKSKWRKSSKTSALLGNKCWLAGLISSKGSWPSFTTLMASKQF